MAVQDSPEMQESREYRLFAELIPNLAWMAEPDGFISWYNQRWYQYTGTTPEQMRGWGWQAVHNPATLPNVLARWRDSIATGQPFEMTFPLRGVDGVFRPFLTRMMPLKDEQGNVLRWFGTNTEIGDELRAVAALRESEQRFRTATRAVSGILWTNNANGEMRGQQPGWSGFTGQTYEQYQGYGWAAAVHPEDAQPTIDAWLDAVRENRLFSFEHRLRRHDGVYRLCSIRSLPICNEDNSVREWVGVHTDITAQKHAEEALRQNDRLAIAGRLAASVAHEINNPLEAVTNLLFLLQYTNLDEEQTRLCQSARDEVERVVEISNRTLRFQRQATGPGWTGMEGLIQSVLTLFSGQLRSSQVQIDSRFRATRKAYIFEGELRQVLANLIGNALDAMDAGSPERTLFLRTQDTRTPSGQPGVVVTVADTGAGIPAPVLHRLFDPFFTTKGDKGTGLGLWISSDIMRSHQGTIRVRSRQAPHRHGTVFRLFLPLEPSPQPPGAIESSAEAKLL